MSYDFLDAYSSVLSARSSVTTGTAHEPIITISSVLSPVPVVFAGSPSISGAVTIVGTPSISGTINVGSTITIGNTPSVSGRVDVSIVGMLPDGTRVLGSVATLQGTNPWRTLGSVSGTVGASVLGSVNVEGTQAEGLTLTSLPVHIGGKDLDGSVVGIRLDRDGDVITHHRASVFTIVDNNSNSQALPVAITSPAGETGILVTPVYQFVFDGTTWDRMRGDATNGAQVYGSVSGNISGSVLSQQLGAVRASVISSTPSSMLVGASVYGQLPAGTAVLGSVAVLQGTNPWNISSVYGNISGSVLAQQLGTVRASVVNSIPSSLLTGNYGHRNDAVASYLGGNLSWNPLATDSAGRVLSRPFAAEEARVEGYGSTVNVSVTTIVPAAGAGLRNYITDVWFANTGSVATLITLKSGGGASVLGYTIAPAGSGSNLPGLVTPIRTGANETFDIQATTGVSVLYATVKGFKAP